MGNPWYDEPTPRGYLKPECSSALQKAIRRGDEEVALFFAAELDLAGFGKYVWKRLLIITSEDIGIAEPHLPATMRALYETWKELRANKGKQTSHRVVLIHAVLLCVRAKKSRLTDDANWAIYKDQDMRLDVPDYAYDMHTIRGKRMGRGADHWEQEGTLLVNEMEGPNPYLAPAMENVRRVKERKDIEQPVQQKDGDDPEDNPAQLAF